MEEYRYEEYRDGVLVHVTDTRTIEGQRAKKLKELREETTKQIESQAPSFKQRNAALGLLTPTEEANLKGVITSYQQKCDQLEQQINAMTDVDAIEALNVEHELNQ